MTYTTNEGGYASRRARRRHPEADRAPSFAAGARLPTTSCWARSPPMEPAGRPRTRAPGALAAAWLVDHRTGTASPWVLPAAPRSTCGRSPRRSLRRTARDGTTDPSLRAPVGALLPATEPCPVLVHFHGGPRAGAAGADAWAQIGVDAVRAYEPNVRGSDGYGKPGSTRTTARSGSTITDIQDAGRCVRRARAERRGAASAFRRQLRRLLRARRHDALRGHLDAGASNVGMVTCTFPQHGPVPSRAPRHRVRRPRPRPRSARQAQPQTYLDRVGAPVLLLQGVSDPRVPVGEACRSTALVKRRVPSEPCSSRTRATARRSARTRCSRRRTLSFFEAHLDP